MHFLLQVKATKLKKKTVHDVVKLKRDVTSIQTYKSYTILNKRQSHNTMNRRLIRENGEKRKRERKKHRNNRKNRACREIFQILNTTTRDESFDDKTMKRIKSLNEKEKARQRLCLLVCVWRRERKKKEQNDKKLTSFSFIFWKKKRNFVIL